MNARSRRFLPFVFLAPALILLGVFVFYPIVRAALTSLTNWNGISTTSDFIGLRNYAQLLVDPEVLHATTNTLLYVALTLPATLVLAFLAALAVERASIASTILRVAFAVPFVISIPVVSIVWVWIFDPNFGLLNYALSLVGLGGQSLLTHPSTAMIGIAIPSVWRQFGYFMLILLAGMKNIDQAYYEAARLDGAGPATRALRLTLPLLGPQLFFCLVLGVIDAFQVFAQVDLMTQGGPLESTDVIVYELYQQGFSYFHTGYACAMAVMLMLVLGLVTFVQQRWLGSKVFYQ
ncbi:carbohydrate ABC transporter permease [Gryllotalpicola reticulitermitis]|uniref:Carbohydrate ABC transporter permease n=1 Tax=Gryllotalpicola reticulitermitis TaxID=1184153 RepID=A0ABV8Q5K1_9MICO